MLLGGDLAELGLRLPTPALAKTVMSRVQLLLHRGIESVEVGFIRDRSPSTARALGPR